MLAKFFQKLLWRWSLFEGNFASSLLLILDYINSSNSESTLNQQLVNYFLVKILVTGLQ